MQVVGHEAVGKNRKSFDGGRTLDLLERSPYCCWIFEDAALISGEKRQQVSVIAPIRKPA
jgi:hypothetical protein